MDYTEKEIARMRYHLPELEALYKRYPQSYVLRNGIANIREVLGLPKTVTKIDVIADLDDREKADRSLLVS